MHTISKSLHVTAKSANDIKSVAAAKNYCTIFFAICRSIAHVTVATGRR